MIKEVLSQLFSLNPIIANIIWFLLLLFLILGIMWLFVFILSKFGIELIDKDNEE